VTIMNTGAMISGSSGGFGSIFSGMGGFGGGGGTATGGAPANIFNLGGSSPSLASSFPGFGGGGGNGFGGVGLSSDISTPPFAGGSTSSGTGSGFGGMLGGFKSTLGNLKGLAGFGNISTDSMGGKWATVGNQSISVDSLGGKLKALSGSSLVKGGMFAGGMALAQNGLLGNSRGTALGALEGAAGGAAVGFSVGGPLGAAIGASVGLSIGIGEMIAGVESPRREAQRLVKQLYRIDINNGTADQIVSLAKQTYGGRVSIAVRSPEVRQMLGLYAAGTGQAGSFPMSSSVAHGASLVQSGGQLFQGAMYQYGNAYAYQSSLPIYGGGAGVNSFGSPGGNTPTMLSLNISGSDAARFMTGQYVTPEFVSSQQNEAWRGSSGRQQSAMTLNEPGSIVA